MKNLTALIGASVLTVFFMMPGWSAEGASVASDNKGDHALATQLSSPQAVRFYWASSGTFGPVPISRVIPSIPKEKQHDIEYPVGMWIIVHPKGLVLYDTGMSLEIADRSCTPFWPAAICDNWPPHQKREDVIDMQLKKLGFSVNDVKYVVISHMHADHGGNMRLFPNATHVVQRKELVESWAHKDDRFVMASLEGTGNLKFLKLDGDHDLFADGSIQILSTPGHTAGHQSVKLRTRNNGTIVLTGDACFMQEVMDGYISGDGYNHDQFIESLNRLKRLHELEGAQLFFPHDPNQFAAKGQKWYD